MDIGAAITAAETAAPATLNTLVQTGVPNVERLTSYAWRITVNYAVEPYVNFQTDDRYEFDEHAEPITFDFAPQIARYPGSAPDYKGLVFPGGFHGTLMGRQGGSQPAPRSNRRYRFRLNYASVTATWVRTVGNLVGRVNNNTMGAYAIGTTMLTDFVGGQVSSTDWEFQIAWSYKPNVTGETRGDVTGIAYHGHDFVWEVARAEVDRSENTLYLVPMHVYVSRPRPYADLSTAGVSPP